MDFRVERDGDQRFRLCGELDLANADDAYGQLEPAVREYGGLCLDLSQLTFIDSQGIHVLLELAKRCAGGNRIVVEGSTAYVARLFELVSANSLPNLPSVPSQKASSSAA